MFTSNHAHLASTRACVRLLTSAEQQHDPAASGELLCGTVPRRRQTSSLGSHDLSTKKASLNC